MQSWGRYIIVFFFVVALLLSISGNVMSVHSSCAPTKPDSLGPYYEPGAPERTSVGKGYILEGNVKSSSDCSPLKGAKIELWLTGTDGEYGDAYRATVYSDSKGAYSFESNFPKGYFFRPPHIHIKVTVEGFKTLITQHYPVMGKESGVFDLVLIPVKL